jgi:hypothetical protein
MIIFTHIPKTAGNSFHAAIARNFPPYSRKGYNFVKEQGVNLLEAFHSGDKVACPSVYFRAHCPYGIHKAFQADYFLYMVILRHPVKRCMSSLRNALRSRHKQAREMRIKHSDHAALAIELLKRDINCNVMTKQLSGLVPPSDIVLGANQKRTANWFPPWLALRKRFDEKQLLEQAKRNLEKYAFIGFQETFEEDVERFCQLFHVEKTHSTERLKQTSRFFFTDSEQTREAIIKMNSADIALYEFARSLRKNPANI